MQAFRVTGRFKMGSSWTRFSKETAAESADDARERVVSTLGSKHRIKRSLVEIDEVEEVQVDDVEDPVVAKRLEEA